MYNLIYLYIPSIQQTAIYCTHFLYKGDICISVVKTRHSGQ